MNKILNPCTYEGKYNTFVRVKYINGNLSITGVEAPMRNGNARGRCGQIVDSLDPQNPTRLWNASMIRKLVQVWKMYHLNDMQSACEHQRAQGITYQNNPKHVCEICEYKIGHAWLRMEVPANVIAWLESLPETEITPAWV